MTNQEFLGEFLSLPTEAQNQVVSLIAYLKQIVGCANKVELQILEKFLQQSVSCTG